MSTQDHQIRALGAFACYGALKMKPACLAIFIALSCLPSGNAQSSGSTSRTKFKCGKVNSAFDNSKNETQVQLRPLILKGIFHIASGETLHSQESLPNDDHGVALSVLYSYQGKVPSKPQSIVIVIEVESAQPKYETERSLSVNLDGEVQKIGLMDRTVQLTGLGFTREDLSVPVSYEQFMKITNAKKVKINLGANSFNLTECHLDALRKFESTMRL